MTAFTSPRETTLPNGIRVVSEAMPAVASVALGVYVGAGARAEGADEHGIAHLLEHMAFKGTRQRSAQRIVEEIEAVGGDINAATSMEQTAYYARMLSADLPLAMDILADIITESILDPEDLKREQSVIRQEIAAVLDTPDDLIFEHLQAAAYPGQSLGRSILGTEDTVSAFRRDHVKAFLDRHYRGPDIVVSAAGDVDHDALVDRVSMALGAVPSDTGPVMPGATFVGGEVIEDCDTEQVNIAIALPGVPMSDEQAHTARIFSSLLGGGMASRLFQEVREKRGLCYTVSAFHWAYADTGLFGLHAATDERQVADLVPVMMDVLAQTARDPRPEELARAKAQARAGLLMSLESSGSRADRLARQMLGYGRLRSIEEIVAAVDKISLDDLRAFATRMLRSGRIAFAAVGRVGNTRPGVPAV